MFFFFSSRRRHTIFDCDWSSDVCSSDLDPSADWARSDNDRRHKFDLLGSTHFTGPFTLGAALSLYSGKPVNVITGADNNGDGVVNDRPLGDARNTLHGPGLVNVDLNLSQDRKSTRLNSS